jgi:integrase
MGVNQDKKKSGKGHWRVSFTFRQPNGERIRVQDYSPVNTKRGAEEHERQLRTALQAGTYRKEQPTEPIKMKTLEEFAEIYFIWANTHLKPSTLADKRNRLKRDVFPLYRASPLDKLGIQEKDALTSALKAKGLSPSSINNSVGVLGSILRYAVEVELLTKAPPSRFVKVPPQGFDFLDFDEFDNLLVTAEKSEWYAAVLLAAEAGLRMGEVRALRWCDIDFRHNKLTIRKALWRSELGSPKGGRERIIPMTKRLASALNHIQHLKGDFVFCQETGLHWSESVFEAVLEGIVKRARLRPIGFKVLRHTFCSHLAMKGASCKAIQELAGHQSLKTTQRYMHLSPAHLREAIGLLDGCSPNARQTEGVLE